MFCLVADVEIRRATGNRKGLQDALRAIVAAGATIQAAREDGATDAMLTEAAIIAAAMRAGGAITHASHLFKE